MLEIVHGSRASADAGQSVRQGLQTMALLQEAQRREDAYQLEKELAGAQVELANQRLALNEQAAVQARDDAIFNRQLALRGAALNERQEARLGRVAERQERALDFEISEAEQRAAALAEARDQQDAAQAFYALEMAGVDPEPMRPALEAAGAVLGGGLREGLRVAADMTPARRELFARMSPAAQAQFLQEEAEAQQEARMERAIRMIPEQIGHLESLGALDSDAATALRERLATADTTEELVSLGAEVEAAGERAWRRETLNNARQTLLAQMDAQRARMMTAVEAIGGTLGVEEQNPTVDDLQKQVARLDALRNQMIYDAEPDLEAYQDDFRSLVRGLSAAQGAYPPGEGPPRVPLTPPRGEAPLMRFDVWASEADVTQEQLEDFARKMALVKYSTELTVEEKKEQGKLLMRNMPVDPLDPVLVGMIEAARAEMEGEQKRESMKEYIEAQPEPGPFRIN